MGLRRRERTVEERFAAADDTALAEVFDAHAGPMLAVAVSQLDDRRLAEEAVQQAFVQAWRAAPTFEPARPLGPWLPSIVRRTAIDIPPRERRHEPRNLQDVSPRDLPTVELKGALLELVVETRDREHLDELRTRMRQILGLDRRWHVALVGAGRLGAALFQYEGFRRQGFDFVAVFDNDPAKIGRRWGEIEVEDVDDLPRAVGRRGIEMAVIATPRESAQDVADRLLDAGVEAILNFAPRKLTVRPGVTLRDVNLAIEIEGLAFALTHAGEIMTGG